MIRLANVCKTYRVNGIAKSVLRSVNLCISETASVALIGRNGAGKSSLLRLIAGTARPNSGRITIDGTVSWPVGFAGSFHGDLTGLQNTRFVARIYGADTDELVEFVRDFSELGQHFFAPFRTYSQGMKARLGFATSMGVDFDTYLIDEVTSVGDEAFREKCETMLKHRLESRGAIVVSHSAPMLKRMCTSSIVIEGGRATWFDDVETGLRQHRENMRNLVGVA